MIFGLWIGFPMLFDYAIVFGYKQQSTYAIIFLSAER